ncbi:MAG: polysaccharide biosynthesis tyrosine autokinase [Deltaproteobacteria bacterium]|nr:polysaccharide biosynthesis tyrosine autokinase [Deltaproteobacteria bacterium]
MAQYDINLREYWRILKKRKFIVVVTAVVLGLFSTTFAILKAPTPVYVSSCSIKFERETTVEGLYAKTISWSGGDDIETQVSVITSFPVFQEVAKKLGLISKEAMGGEDTLKPHVVALVEDLQSKVEVARQNYTNILDISVSDTSPVFAQRLANAIGVAYREWHSRNQMKRTTEAIHYIEDQLKNVREKLRQSEDAFNTFTQQNQLISIDLQGENLLSRSQEVEADIRKLGDENRELEGLLKRVEEFIRDPSDTRHNFYSAKANAQYQAANDSLVELYLKRETLLQDFTVQHPEVIANSRKIGETTGKMAVLLRLQIKDNLNKVGDLENELAQVDHKTNTLMEKKLEYNRLKRNVELHSDMTALLERKQQEAMIRQAEKPEEVTIVKPALLPTRPINPPKTAATGAMGVLIGLVLGLVTAFIVETFDTSLGAIEDVEETLGTQVLGVVPHADIRDIQESLAERRPDREKEKGLLQTVHLVSHFSPKSMIAESFRALRTNIQFKDTEKTLGSLAITSASPQEGKTLVSINLSIAMAQAGVKTLLVGSDMRKPMLARVFGVEITPGLTDILLGNYPWRDTIKTVTDLIMGKMSLDEVMMTPGLDNLNLITAGSIPPNPAELIESKRLTDFIEEAKEEYDLVIFDSPPILSTADAAILGSKVDGVLLVYRVGSVSKGLLKRATTQLEQVKCNVLGVILNGMKPEISPDFQDFKYYKYYYSYGEGSETKRPGEKKGLFHFFREAKADRKARREAGREGKTEPGASGPRAGKKGSSLRLYLLAMGALFLIGGLLWQNGVIDPIGMFVSKGAADKGADRAVVQRKPIPVPVSGAVPKSPAVSIAETPREAQAERRRGVPPPETIRASTEEESGKAGEDARTNLSRRVTRKEEDRGKGDNAAAAPSPPAEDIAAGASPLPSGEEGPSYPYSLYLGSFRSRERAEKAVSRYVGDGLSTYWVKMDFGEKGIWYRAFAGYFATRKEVESLIERQGLTEAEVKKTAFAVLVGTFSDPGSAEGKLGELRDLGYSPYVVKDTKGADRLYVGAFVTRAGAEIQHRELTDRGVSGEVVTR